MFIGEDTYIALLKTCGNIEGMGYMLQLFLENAKLTRQFAVSVNN